MEKSGHRDGGPLKAIGPRKSLGEHVFDTLRQAIVSGHMAPGDRLVESRIAQALEISRTPVREAIHKLEREGFICRRPRGGFTVLGFSRKDIEETFEILESMGLADKADRISASLSHGDQKVLEMAIALGSRPRLLILDEPTAGMSPEETTVALELMKRLNREMGLTILFCEHDMELVFTIAQRIMVMQLGKTLIEDTPEKVRCDAQVQAAYLGGADVC
jgi:branched-chain amino acid transport system ATP-binding protein